MVELPGKDSERCVSFYSERIAKWAVDIAVAKLFSFAEEMDDVHSWLFFFSFQYICINIGAHYVYRILIRVFDGDPIKN